jgi:hypothetical protein
MSIYDKMKNRFIRGRLTTIYSVKITIERAIILYTDSYVCETW